MKKRVFPNTQVVASYSTYGEYISLKNYTKKSWNAKRPAADSKSAKDFSIYLHEFQHWLDHHATLWGIRNIFMLYNAFNVWLEANESNFNHIRKFTLDIKGEEFKEYYSQIINDISGSFAQPWQYKYSAGARYSLNGEVDESRPILFISFANTLGKPISRVPVSIVTLLEVKAMAIEITNRMAYIDQLSESKKKLRLFEFNADLETWLYNPDFCIYNAAVHITSTFFNVKDIVFGFNLASLFSSVALNFPHSLRNQIKYPVDVDAWGDRPKALFEGHDLGFIFWCLNNNAHAAGLDPKTITVDSILKASGIKGELEYRTEINKEIDALETKIIPGLFGSRTHETIKWYREFIDKHGCHPMAVKQVFESEIVIRNPPQIAFSDSRLKVANRDAANLILLLFERTGIIEFDNYYALVHFFEEKFNEFDAVCGV